MSGSGRENPPASNSVLQHGRIPLTLQLLFFAIIFLFHFLLASHGAIFAIAGPHSRNVVDIGAISDHSFPEKANVDPACSIVTKDENLATWREGVSFSFDVLKSKWQVSVLVWFHGC